VRPWRAPAESSTGCSSTQSALDATDPWYYQCLPSEEELLLLHKKTALWSNNNPSSIASLPSSDSSTSMQKELVKHHLQSKSLIVPLTDDATAFILSVLFEIPVDEAETGQTLADDNMSLAHDEETYQRVNAVQKWFFNTAAGITIVHNCDRNQTVSLSKEVDSFPQIDTCPPPSSSSSSTASKDKLCYHQNRPNNKLNNNNNGFTFVDLFAGIGGFRIAMEALGGTCVGSCEIDPHARETYRRNFLMNEGRRHRCDDARKDFFVNDITRLEIPKHTVDMLCGGFPCQSFSTMASFPSSSKENIEDDAVESTSIMGRPDGLNDNAENGKKSNNTRQGGLHTQHKGKLFFHLLRILRKSQPKMFVFENVKGLMHLDNGSHFQKILHLLEESGYDVSHGIFDAAWILPQRRERVYFVGVRRDVVSGGTSFWDEEAFRSKYQIYGNDIAQEDGMDKFDRVLLNNGNRHNQPECFSSAQHPLPTSRLGDILESNETVSKQYPHCFLTPSQWQKVRGQGYLQLHSDGSGRLLMEDDVRAQTLVSSYRQSFLMHSQFLVPCDSVYLVEQRQRLVAEAYKKKRQYATNRCCEAANDETCISDNTKRFNDQTLPRFFYTPRMLPTPGLPRRLYSSF